MRYRAQGSHCDSRLKGPIEIEKLAYHSQQRRHIGFEGLRDAHQGEQGRIALSALNGAQVGRVEVSSHGELGSRQPSLPTQGRDAKADMTERALLNCRNGLEPRRTA